MHFFPQASSQLPLEKKANPLKANCQALGYLKRKILAPEYLHA
jgi:hypothetical protein